jgi:hypothetical protein
MDKQDITLENILSGTVEKGTATFSGDVQGELTEYLFDLKNNSGIPLKFSLFKNGKGEWTEPFFMPLVSNNDVPPEIKKMAKEKIKELDV